MKRISALLLSFGVLAACQDADRTTSLSEQDVQAVQMAVAEALSDQHDGTMTDLYDMQGTLYAGGAAKAGASVMEGPGQPPVWRGDDHNRSYTYDSTSGTHTYLFQRSHQRVGFSKTLDVRLEYRFTSPGGTFLQFPRRDTVATIEFVGRREGTHTGPVRNAEFLRESEWTLTGLEPASTLIHLTGTQTHTGSMSINAPDTSFSRSYRLHMDFTDVTLDKGYRNAETLEGMVSGTIQYEIEMVRTGGDGAAETKTLSGSIDLTGDGRALLRIMGVRQVVRIDLARGTIQR